MNTRLSGSQGEDFAAAYIQEQGMKIVARNYRFGREEIDIIAKDADDVAAISGTEIKYIKAAFDASRR